MIVDKKSPSIMMVVSVYSPDERYSDAYIGNYTNLYVLEELKRIPGANRSSVFGSPDIAMRVWLRPDRMAQLGIGVNDVANAVKSQNQTFGIGQIGAPPGQGTSSVRGHRPGPAQQAGRTRTSSCARPGGVASVLSATSAASSSPSATIRW
jgi:multidrug efflux pump subunit AcrB